MTRSFCIVPAVLLGAVVLGACSGPAPSPDSSSPDVGSRVYHVQLQLTEDKSRAEAVLNRGVRWWNRRPASSRPPLV